MTIRPILADVMTLFTHAQLLAFLPDKYKPDQCPHCSAKGLWNHGSYSRKADKTKEGPNSTSLNPLLIPRYLCSVCHHTCSTLPECLPARRWYQWSVQEEVIRYYLKGYSAYTINRLVMPSIMTIYRWIHRFLDQFKVFEFHLKIQDTSLGYAENINEFWISCFDKNRLSHWMLLLNNEGVIIP